MKRKWSTYWKISMLKKKISVEKPFSIFFSGVRTMQHRHTLGSDCATSQEWDGIPECAAVPV